MNAKGDELGHVSDLLYLARAHRNSARRSAAGSRVQAYFYASARSYIRAARRYKAG